jgi:hypothetical protein
METLHLTTWGTSRAPLEALLMEAATAYRASQRQRTGVWSVDQVGAAAAGGGGNGGHPARSAGACQSSGGRRPASCAMPTLARASPGPPRLQDGYWQQVGSRPVRPLSSVVLPDGQVRAGSRGGVAGVAACSHCKPGARGLAPSRPCGRPQQRIPPPVPPPRPQASALLDDCREFLESEEWWAGRQAGGASPAVVGWAAGPWGSALDHPSTPRKPEVKP